MSVRSDGVGGVVDAGVKVERDSAGNAAVPLEVSPRFALDADELKARVWPGRAITKPTYFE